MKLRERFRRLYDLSIYKDKTVGEMGALGWGKMGMPGGGGLGYGIGRRS
jgi:hypothetical protein